jgi:riboflavin kinase/FMN adenylyltransferase
VHGAALGRTLGFPTANLDLMHELHPPRGVYACRVRVFDAPPAEASHLLGPCLVERPAVANIGCRPTVATEPPDQLVVEAHLLDFSADLYGRDVELEFVRRLRDERRFEDLDQLRTEIARDIAHVRALLVGR